MVATVGDRIDGWWSRKTDIGDSRRARVLVFMQRGRFPIERNGARKTPRAPTPNYALDNAVVVIDALDNAVVVIDGRRSSRMPPLARRAARVITWSRSKTGRLSGHPASRKSLGVRRQESWSPLPAIE